MIFCVPTNKKKYGNCVTYINHFFFINLDHQPIYTFTAQIPKIVFCVVLRFLVLMGIKEVHKNPLVGFAAII